MKELKKLQVILLIIAFLMTTLSYGGPVHASPVVAHTCLGQATGTSTTATCMIDNIGDLIIVNVQLNNGVNGGASTVSVTTITDDKGNTYGLRASQHLNFPTTCLSGNCLDSEVWSAVAVATGSTTITVTASLASTGIGIEAIDVTGATTTVAATATGTGLSTASYFTSSSLIYHMDDFLDASIRTDCAASFTFNAGTGFTKQVAGNPFMGAAQYSVAGAANPSNFPATCSGGTSNWIDVAVIFGTVLTGSYACTITNMDASNYLIPQGKFYDFKCTVASTALNPTNAAITDVQIRFNDSVNIITVEYNNSTQVFSVNKGNGFISLGSGGVTNSIASGVRTIVVHFAIALATNIVDSKNRGIELYAANANGVTRVFEYVQTNYFNILNQGGQVEQKVSGLCSVPAGADTFQTICQYQASPKSWIAQNSTWYKLQSFQAQFAIKLANNYGNPDHFLFQDYPNSGAGAENSTNPGDWKINIGLYYHDNSTWVKGINAIITMLKGDQGTVDEWIQFNVQWYNGNTFIENATSGPVVGWIEQNPLSQTSLWVNLWYSQNNASTSQGGRVAAYYTGMHNSGYLWWTGWSPLIQNSTSSLAFLPIKDHSGNVMSSSQAQFTKVFMNMSRPGAPAVHTGQINFQVQTRAFQVEDFLRTNGPMAAVDTPVFAPAVVPQIQSNFFLSPLIKAVQAIATFFINGLQYLGTVVWSGLGARFPWFTSALGNFSVLIVDFASLLGSISGYLGSFLTFLSTAFGPVTTIVTVIGNAWATIQSIYLPIFTGANLTAIITIVVLWVFWGWFMENAEKNNTGAFANAAMLAWRVTNAILLWTWSLAKILIDTIEGLIP